MGVRFAVPRTGLAGQRAGLLRGYVVRVRHDLNVSQTARLMHGMSAKLRADTMSACSAGSSASAKNSTRPWFP